MIKRNMMSHPLYGTWDKEIVMRTRNRNRRNNPMYGDEELRLRQDHGASANYLKNKRESASNAGFYRTPKGTLVPKDFGPDTASFNRDVLFPVSLLADIPGLTGEETFEREESMRYLLPFMETYNHLPTYKTFRGEELQTSPFIQVWINGKWYVNEGNHRIKVARRLGWKYIPLQIRWFSGADLESHPEGFTPEQVIAFDTLAHNEGYSVINFRGKIRTL